MNKNVETSNETQTPKLGISDVSDSKKYVIIGINNLKDWDILSNWYLKSNQSLDELRLYALNNFCLTFDDAKKMKEEPEIKNEGGQYKKIEIVHIDEILELMKKDGFK